MPVSTAMASISHVVEDETQAQRKRRLALERQRKRRSLTAVATGSVAETTSRGAAATSLSAAPGSPGSPRHDRSQAQTAQPALSQIERDYLEVQHPAKRSKSVEGDGGPLQAAFQRPMVRSRCLPQQPQPLRPCRRSASPSSPSFLAPAAEKQLCMHQQQTYQAHQQHQKPQQDSIPPQPQLTQLPQFPLPPQPPQPPPESPTFPRTLDLGMAMLVPVMPPMMPMFPTHMRPLGEGVLRMFTPPIFEPVVRLAQQSPMGDADFTSASTAVAAHAANDSGQAIGGSSGARTSTSVSTPRSTLQDVVRNVAVMGQGGAGNVDSKRHDGAPAFPDQKLTSAYLDGVSEDDKLDGLADGSNKTVGSGDPSHMSISRETPGNRKRRLDRERQRRSREKRKMEAKAAGDAAFAANDVVPGADKSDFQGQGDVHCALAPVQGPRTQERQQKQAHQQERYIEQKKQGTRGYLSEMKRHESTFGHDPEQNRQPLPYQKEAQKIQLTRDRLGVDLREQSAVLHSASNTPSHVACGMYARQYSGPHANPVFSSQGTKYKAKNGPVTGSESRSVVCPSHQPVLQERREFKMPTQPLDQRENCTMAKSA